MPDDSQILPSSSSTKVENAAPLPTPPSPQTALLKPVSFFRESRVLSSFFFFFPSRKLDCTPSPRSAPAPAEHD